MSQAQPDALTDLLGAVASLGEHVERAREVLPKVPLGPGGHPDGKGPLLSQAIELAHGAVLRLAAFAQGHTRSFPSGATLRLHRHGHRVFVEVLGSPAAGEVRAYLQELARIDRGLLESAELLGLLLGLSAQWVAAGFAPPVVLLTLSQSAPRILELGAGLTTELTAG